MRVIAASPQSQPEKNVGETTQPISLRDAPKNKHYK